MTAKTTDYSLRVYRRDYRYKTGERLVKTERHEGVTFDWITRYAAAVQSGEGITRVEWQEQWTTVKNLITGQDVVIRSQDRGTCVDPSQERFWCQ